MSTLRNAPPSVGYTTVKHYLDDTFNIKHSDLWTDFCYVLVFLAVFRVLALLALRYVNHQKR